MKRLCTRLALAGAAASLLMAFAPTAAHADDPGGGQMVAGVVGGVGTGGVACTPSDEDSHIWPTVIANSGGNLAGSTISFTNVVLPGVWVADDHASSGPVIVNAANGISACQVTNPATGVTIGGTVGGNATDTYSGGSVTNGLVLSGFDVVAGAVAVATFDSTFTVAGTHNGTVDAVALLAVVPCSTVDTLKDNIVTGEGSALDNLTDPLVVTACNTIKAATAPDEADDIVVGAVLPFVTSGPQS